MGEGYFFYYFKIIVNLMHKGFGSQHLVIANQASNIYLKCIYKKNIVFRSSQHSMVNLFSSRERVGGYLI